MQPVFFHLFFPRLERIIEALLLTHALRRAMKWLVVSTAAAALLQLQPGVAFTATGLHARSSAVFGRHPLAMAPRRRGPSAICAADGADADVDADAQEIAALEARLAELKRKEDEAAAIEAEATSETGGGYDLDPLASVNSVSDLDPLASRREELYGVGLNEGMKAKEMAEGGEGEGGGGGGGLVQVVGGIAAVIGLIAFSQVPVGTVSVETYGGAASLEKVSGVYEKVETPDQIRARYGESVAPESVAPPQLPGGAPDVAPPQLPPSDVPPPALPPPDIPPPMIPPGM